MSDKKARKVRSPIIEKILKRIEIPTKLKVFFEMTWLMENIVPDRQATDEEIKKASEWSEKMTKETMEIFNETSLKKVFVVECATGSWDEYVSWIGGIYTDKDKAEQAKDILNDYAKKVQNNMPVKPDKGSDPLVDLEDDDDKKYWSYYVKNKKWMEWKEAIVKEFKTNIPLFELSDLKSELIDEGNEEV